MTHIQQAFEYYSSLSQFDRSNCRSVRVPVNTVQMFTLNAKEPFLQIERPEVVDFSVHQLREYAVSELINTQKQAEKGKETIRDLRNALASMINLANARRIFLHSAKEEQTLSAATVDLICRHLVTSAHLEASAFEVLKNSNPTKDA